MRNCWRIKSNWFVFIGFDFCTGKDVFHFDEGLVRDNVGILFRTNGYATHHRCSFIFKERTLTRSLIILIEIPIVGICAPIFIWKIAAEGIWESFFHKCLVFDACPTGNIAGNEYDIFFFLQDEEVNYKPFRITPAGWI